MIIFILGNFLLTFDIEKFVWVLLEHSFKLIILGTVGQTQISSHLSLSILVDFEYVSDCVVIDIEFCGYISKAHIKHFFAVNYVHLYDI